MNELPYALRKQAEAKIANYHEMHTPPPDLVPEIGAWLQTCWPVRVPTVDMSMAEIQREAGRQDMIHSILLAIAYLDEQELCADQPPP
jgi:hypothetical protein